VLDRIAVAGCRLHDRRRVRCCTPRKDRHGRAGERADPCRRRPRVPEWHSL